MNDWFEWNGVRCTQYGIHTSELPPPTIPSERVTYTNVPGRPGSLTTLEGEDVYEDVVLTAQCFLSDPTKIPAIAAWLKGSGKVAFANRQGGFYYARIANQISFEKILRGNPHRSFAVNFRCKPFWYQANVALVTLTASTSTILASYAQEESRSVSENCKWRIRNQFRAGEPANWRFMYGYRIQHGKITVHPVEAEVVREVFRRYLEGETVASIAEWLREQRVPSYRDGMWTAKRVLELLKNEKYAGNALLQKKYVTDHLSKKEKRNFGELPRYYAEGTHPAIVSPETFKRTQEQIERNRVKNGIQQVAPSCSIFTGMLVCGQCGKKYKRKMNRGKPSWNCTTYLMFGKSYCHTKQIPEDILMATTASVLGMQSSRTLLARMYCLL